MPWELRYPDDLDSRITMRGHRTLFQECPDVVAVSERRHPRIGLDIVFRGDVQGATTSDPRLLEIYQQYGHHYVPIYPVETAHQPPLNRLPDPEGPNGERHPPEVREQILREYLSTEEGRRRLAASMVQPLRGPRDYPSVARRLLPIQQLPDGALPVYDREPFHGIDANGSPVPPQKVVLPSWVQEGQWAFHARLNTFGQIERITPNLEDPRCVTLILWRQNGLVTVQPVEVFLSDWVPCEKPTEPRMSWERLLEEPLF